VATKTVATAAVKGKVVKPIICVRKPVKAVPQK
jgi:hypothetical protein